MLWEYREPQDVGDGSDKGPHTIPQANQNIITYILVKGEKGGAHILQAIGNGGGYIKTI